MSAALKKVLHEVRILRAEEDAVALYPVMEDIYKRGGMRAVLEACRAVQRRIIERHPHEREQWIV